MADKETIEEQPRCEVTIYGGVKCDRPLYDDSKCICHSENPDKDLHLFRQEIKAVLESIDSAIIDFTNFVFPASGWELPTTFSKKVSFADCRFNGHVKFEDCKFKLGAIFTGVSFSENVSFTHAEFYGKTCFKNAKFSGKISFLHAQFYRDVDFTDAHFFKYATFWGAFFKNEAGFNKAVFHDDGNFCVANFNAESSFSLAEFHQKAQFMTTDFRGPVSFRSAQLGKNHTGKESEIDFSGATFHSMADFGWITDGLEHQILVAQDYGSLPKNGAVFRGDIGFRNTHFVGNARFERCRFVGVANFVEVVFRDKANFIKSRFRLSAVFRGIKFDKDTTFATSTFYAKASFLSVTFGGSTDFLRTIFMQDVEFMDCKFKSKVDFNNTECLKHALFNRSEFHQKVHFKQIVFQRKASFNYTEFHASENAIFHGCNLENVSFLECDISRVKFVGVSWNTQRKPFELPRNKVLDELLCNTDTYDAVAQEYRQLQSNYVHNYRYVDAGDFFIGEQEMMRKNNKWFWRLFSIRAFYWTFCRYGESMIRPISWLVFLLFMCSSILFYNGVYIESGSTLQPTSYYVDYNWSGAMSDLVLLKADFWKTFTHNLALVSFYRSGPCAPKMGSWQQLLIIAETVAAVSLITLFLLALRRKCARKSF